MLCHSKLLRATAPTLKITLSSRAVVAWGGVPPVRAMGLGMFAPGTSRFILPEAASASAANGLGAFPWTQLWYCASLQSLSLESTRGRAALVYQEFYQELRDREPMRPSPIYKPGEWVCTAGLSRLYTLEVSNCHLVAPAVLGVTLHRFK